jgi:hypothetical protein
MNITLNTKLQDLDFYKNRNIKVSLINSIRSHVENSTGELKDLLNLNYKDKYIFYKKEKLSNIGYVRAEAISVYITLANILERRKK